MGLLSSSNNVDVHVATTADNKGIDSTERGIKGMAQSVDHSSGIMGKFTGAVFLGNVAADAFTKGVTAIGSAAAGAFGELVNLQNTRQSFEVLTGSAANASKVMADLSKYAMNTPFEFNQIAGATKTLLGFGSTVDGVGKQIRQIGDIAGATGGDMGRIALVFGQVQAQGRLMGGDFLQLVNNGVALGDVLSKQLKIPASKLKDEIEAGHVTFEQFSKAIDGATSAGGKFYGGAEKMAQTLSGRWSTMKDSFTGLVGAMVGVNFSTGVVEAGGIFESLSNSLASVNSWVSNNQKSITAFAQTVNGTVMASVRGLMDVWSLLTTGFTKDEAFGDDKRMRGFAKALQTVHGGLVGIVDIAKILITGNFRGGMLGMQEDDPFINTLFAIREGIIGVVTAIAGYWVAAFTTARAGVQFLIPPIMSLWSNINTNLVPALQKFWGIVGPILIPGLKVLGVIVGATLIGALYILVQGLNLVVSTLTFLYNTSAMVISGMVAGFNGLVAGVIWLKNNWIEAIGFMIGFFFTLPFKVVGAMWSAINGIIGAVGSINWGGVANRIGGAFVGMWDWVKNAAIGAFNFMMGINWGALLVNVGKGFGNSIISLLQGALNGALAGLPGKPKINLPRFAQGGVFDSATAGIFGEDGPEAIIPLSKPARAREVMAAAGLGGGKTEVTIGTVVLGSADAVDRFFAKLDQDTMNLGKGLSSVRRMG